MSQLFTLRLTFLLTLLLTLCLNLCFSLLLNLLLSSTLTSLPILTFTSTLLPSLFPTLVPALPLLCTPDSTPSFTPHSISHKFHFAHFPVLADQIHNDSKKVIFIFFKKLYVFQENISGKHNHTMSYLILKFALPKVLHPMWSVNQYKMILDNTIWYCVFDSQ